MDTFGKFVKQRRLDQQLGLREFCQRVRLDPSNYSKIERGLLEPPQPGSHQFVLIAEALHIEPDLPEMRELERLASVARGMIPPELLQREGVAAKLPGFFRTLSGERISEEEREDLIRFVREA